MIMRIQRTAPEAIGETEATQLGKDGKCWGDPSRRFFHRCRVPFFLYNKQDSQHSGSCSREGRATGSGGGGGLCHRLRKTQKQVWEGDAYVQIF